MRRTIAPLLTVLILISTAGCPQEKYKITMERQPDGQVRRTVTVWTEGGDPNVANQATTTQDPTIDATPDNINTNATPREQHLKSIYGKPKASPDKKRTYEAVFSKDLPQDLIYEGHTNHPYLAQIISPMGQTIAYTEQLPGQSSMLEVARSADKLVDISIKALYAYAADHPVLRDQPDKLAKLKTFMENDLRDDLLNVGLILWLNHPRDGEPEDSNSLSHHVGSYLIQRGYLKPQDFILSYDMHTKAIEGLLRKIATVLGYDPTEPLPPVIAELRDGEKLNEALDAGLAKIGMTEEQLSETAANVLVDFAGDAPSGTHIWNNVTEPVETNGEWNAETKQLIWNTYASTGAQPPQILYAHWDVPNDTVQKEHLGRVVLTGNNLRDYNIWCDKLPTEQRKQWNDFLLSCKPNPQLKDQLSSFRFTNADIQQQGNNESDSPQGASLILGALTSEKD